MEGQKGKNWLATMLACWFLGPLGMHRFYTGKKNTAWVMLVLTILTCTAPISWIWSIVDGFMIALGKFKHADGSELYERINWVGVVYIVLAILGIVFVLFYFTTILALAGAMAGGAGAGAGAGAGF